MQIGQGAIMIGFRNSDCQINYVLQNLNFFLYQLQTTEI